MDFVSSPSKPAIAAVVSNGGIGKGSPASCIRYHENGRKIYVAMESDSKLQVIDALTGKADTVAPFKCEREQISIVEPTHHEKCILFAGGGASSSAPPSQLPMNSTQRHAISYWSLHDNKLLRKFKGHTDTVTGISMCPADDTFLTSSLDGSVRLWNAQHAGCLAHLNIPQATADIEPGSSPLAVFDSTGLVFLCTASMAAKKGKYIHLYDARNYSGGAFAELKLSQPDLEQAILAHNPGILDAGKLSRGEWRTATFNKSGSQILIGADYGVSIVLDGFEGTVQNVVLEASKRSDRPAVSCFSSDDKTIITGNDDGSLSCFDLASATVVRTLQGHLGRVNAVTCNPEYAQMASCCTQTALWLW